MSTLVKKMKLFGANGTPVTYTGTNGRLITPTPRLNRRNRATGLVTSRSLTSARTNDERAYVREVARYYVVTGKMKEAGRLIKTMSAADRRRLFETLTVAQLVDYFVSLAGPLARTMGRRMKKGELVDVAVGG